MRHLRSIFYALVLAPCIWVLLAVGFTDDLSSRGRDFFAAESISGLLLLLFSGILFSILAAGPVSPAGPVLAGAAYLGVTVWAFNAPEAYAALWAPEVAKEGFDLSRPGYGLAAVLAIPLLGTALSARRWARYEPPVLPIIGEIGRFRGAAKVAGTPVAAEQTTVIRTGVPADRTVALGNGPAADRTVAINSGPAADPTVAISSVAAGRTAGRPDGGRTEADGNNDRTVFVTQPQSPARPPVATPATPPVAPPVATTTPPAPPVTEAEPTTVLAIGADEPTIVSGMGLAAPKPAAPKPATKPAAPTPPATEPAATNPAAPAAAKPAAEKDEDTVAQVWPDEDRMATSADPDETRPLLMPAKASTETAKAAPADEKTVPAGVTTPADEKTVPAGVTTPAEEKTVPAGVTTQTGESAVPAGVTGSADEKTTPLHLPGDPTAVIPAQRRPPSIES
ncbi:hypothetical protein AB0G04_30130 [Actinoplanes sp. NPDC023801]|uniref:hypothetical protein n=1 Tax=Actinoplanes sp. NPDC023801 TaxID=3154595 RepID=UPI0034085600